MLLAIVRRPPGCGSHDARSVGGRIAKIDDRYSRRCSCTIRTPCSWTSGESLLVFFMAPSSQELEPHQELARFR